MERFAKESEKNRLSRDVFIFDPETMDFLVKPWGASTATNEGHRSNLKFGNAFGTFLYRPPKDDIDLQKQKDISTEMMIKGEGIVLKFDVSEGVVGWKTKELNKVIRKRQFPYDKSEFMCITMPSKSECRTSSISAPMTVLAYFLPVAKSKIAITENYRWLKRLDATDPSMNVHASIVSTFLCKIDINDLKTFQGSNVEKIMKIITS